MQPPGCFLYQVRIGCEFVEKFAHSPLKNKVMKSIIETLISFAQLNPNFSILLAIATIFMIIAAVMAFVSLFPYPKYAESNDKNASIVTAVLTIVFIVAGILVFMYTPSLALTDTGAQILGTLVVLYALMVWRFKNPDVWIYGFFDFL